MPRHLGLKKGGRQGSHIQTHPRLVQDEKTRGWSSSSRQLKNLVGGHKEILDLTKWHQQLWVAAQRKQEGKMEGMRTMSWLWKTGRRGWTGGSRERIHSSTNLKGWKEGSSLTGRKQHDGSNQVEQLQIGIGVK